MLGAVRMASLFGSWGADPFAELVEKATSELLPAGQEDIALNLEICDQVRAKQVPPKQAMQALKRRISHKNPNVVLLALGLTDICIKNGGDHFLAEVASREFMDNLASILRNPSGVNFDVKSKALRLVQEWAQISEAKPLQMGYIVDTFKSLKASGFEFPAPDPNTVVSAALVETLTAPEWTDSDVCMRCRTAFTTFNRKHHCRNCGNVFCQDCSSKTMALPWFGVGQDVRVCDGCFAKKAPPKTASSSSGNGKLSRSRSTVVPSGRGGMGSHQRSNTLGSSSSARAGGSSLKKKEEDELALAIKLSLEASGSAPSRPDLASAQSTAREGRPTKQADGRMLEGTDADDDPDLAAAIAASLRDYAAPEPSAPYDDGRATPRMTDFAASNQGSQLPLPPSLELPAADVDTILTFSQDAFSQEMYARQYGRWQRDPSRHQQLQSDYERATAARPRMAKSLDEATRRHGVLISMHDKLSEAVRLYDRLLDAQMNRPAYGAYGQAPFSHRPAEQYYSQGSPQMAQFAQPNTARTYVEDLSPAMYPTLPYMTTPTGAYGHSGLNVPSSNGQVPSAGYGIPESPSPYPSHQGYFAPQESPHDSQLAYHTGNTGASQIESVYGQHAPAQQSARQHQSSTQYTSQASAPPLGHEANAAAGQWQSPGGAALSPSTPMAYMQPLWNPVNLQQPANEVEYADLQQRHNQVQGGPEFAGQQASLSTAMSSMGLSSPVMESPASTDTTVIGAHGKAQPQSFAQASNQSAMRLQNDQQPQRQQRAQHTSAPQVVNVPDDQGWRDVPITHSGAAAIASAPPPPNTMSSTDANLSNDNGNVNLPSVPSAPIASPDSKRFSSQPISITYDGMTSPAMATQQQQQQQPWTRPVETPLIDL